MGKIKEILKIKKAEESDIGMDEIDEFLKQQAKEMVTKAKLARVKEYWLESELKAKKLERELREMEEEEKARPRPKGREQYEITETDVEIAKMLKDLPPHERAEVLNILAALKAAGRGEPASLLIPMIMAAKSANPYASPTEIVNAVTNAAKTIVELREGGSTVDKIVSKALDVLSTPRGATFESKLAEKYIDLMEKVISSPQKGFWDQIFEDPKKLQTLKEIFGAKTDPKLLIELEKLRHQHRLEEKKLELKMLELKHKILSARRREKILKGYGKRIAKTVIHGILSSSESPEKPAPKGLPKGWVTRKCEVCGTPITFNPEEAKTVICPKCGTKYRIEVE